VIKTTTPAGIQTPTTTGKLPTPVQPTATEAADAARTLANLESSYKSLPDFSKKVGAIYEISEVGGAPAVESLGRLFQAEKDAELRVEIVDSLFDIDGQDQQKLAILSAAAASDQPQEVRESAIDALTDIDAKVAMPILQALASDSNEEIRDAAKDALEILKATGASK